MSRILLVEDDKDIIENLSAVLRAEGFQVRAEEGQKEALEALEEEGFTVTIHGKGTYVAAVNSEVLLEEQKKELEADLTKAVAKGRQCGISDEDMKEMFELILEG